jgi:hypothetical protein
MRYVELGEITTFANAKKNKHVFGIGWTREEQSHPKFALPPIDKVHHGG